MPRSKVKVLVCGAGGFIGHHLVNRLTSEGFGVRGVDLTYPAYSSSRADEFLVGDLRDPEFCREALDGPFSHVYQLAADMGGAGYIFTGDHDAAIMHNSAIINLNVLQACRKLAGARIFFASSACIYPKENQSIPERPVCVEGSAYPADPDSNYGWEKLFSERLYQAYERNAGLQVRIARLHNVFGEECAWNDGREKVPAALCRKVASAAVGGEIEIWGDGRQTRSFLHISECLEGIRRLTDSSFSGPVNLGSSEMVTIKELADRIIRISGKRLRTTHVPGPQGVRGRCSDNRLIRQHLGWAPSQSLDRGLETLYRWIEGQLKQGARSEEPG